MPCKDTKSVITVRLDSCERLINFNFNKDTCGKVIGDGTGYNAICIGMKAEDILNNEFSEIVERLEAEGSEEQFLLYLEWDALRSAIAQYLGKDDGADTKKRQIASIIHDGENVEISQIIQPLENMPKLVPCRVRAKESDG